jgi:hypothetical protein
VSVAAIPFVGLDMEDPFDSAINLEDQHIQEGYLKGIE